MTSLDPEEVTSPEGVGPPHTQRQEQQEGPVIPSSNVSTSAVPPPPRQRQQQRQHLPSLPSSLVLLSTSTTDPSLFSFDIVKKLNQEHLATIPPNPYSAISIAQHQQQSYQVRISFVTFPHQFQLCSEGWIVLTSPIYRCPEYIWWCRTDCHLRYWETYSLVAPTSPTRRSQCRASFTA